MPDADDIQAALTDLLQIAPPVIVIVVAALIAIRAARVFVHGALTAVIDKEAAEGTAQELSAVEVAKRIDTIETFASNVIQFFIVVIASLMILGKLNVDIGPAVAGLGVVGIAVGFGSQSLVRDYFTGALILIENQYSIGDVVDIAGVTGTVEDFSLRRTTLRDMNGVVHTVPNGEIKVASNKTRVWARINEDVTVAYGTDIDTAIGVVDGVGRSLDEDPVWKRRILEPPRVERVEALGEYGVTLKILGSVRAQDQWAAGGEFRKRLLAAFHENGIEIPRPQRVILAQGDGTAAPMPLPLDAPPASPGSG
jgi:small conductance mechanosensitive channel